MKKMNSETAFNLAQALEALVRGASTREDVLNRFPEYRDSLDSYLESVQGARDLQQLNPRESFRKNARIRILNVVQASYGKTPVQAPAQASRTEVLTRRLGKLLVTMSVTLVVLFLGAWFTFSSSNALPGDVLYFYKLSFENLQRIGASTTEDAILQAQFASARLTEIQLLTVQQRYEDIPQAVDGFERNIDYATAALAEVARTDSASTMVVFEQMQTQLKNQSDILSSMLVLVPLHARPELERALAAASLFVNGAQEPG
jgi:hypothetical protein